MIETSTVDAKTACHFFRTKKRRVRADKFCKEQVNKYLYWKV